MSHTSLEPTKKPLLSDVWYDRLKWVALVGLPGATTFYAAVALYWGIPHTEQIVGTLVALDTLLGVLIGQANKTYKESPTSYDGLAVMRVDEENLTRNLSISLPDNGAHLFGKDEIVLKVKHE